VIPYKGADAGAKLACVLRVSACLGRDGGALADWTGEQRITKRCVPGVNETGKVLLGKTQYGANRRWHVQRAFQLDV